MKNQDIKKHKLPMKHVLPAAALAAGMALPLAAYATLCTVCNDQRGDCEQDCATGCWEDPNPQGCWDYCVEHVCIPEYVSCVNGPPPCC